MGTEKIIIADTIRPLWQTILAAVCFTACTCVFWLYFSQSPEVTDIETHRDYMEMGVFFLITGIGLCYKRGIQIKPLSKEFKATFEIGPLVLGEWKKIPNPEYVSVFQQAVKQGNSIFEVNLWYDTNKHWELYTNTDYRESFIIGFDLSEELDIDLLDATTPNDYKWIDKDKWRKELNETS
ncbi:hypothetical protein [uncultured Dokdonia sp.]|uniref:hypothetical protein n=1 Tax=uncultured Dokdonia sp. TaxID=575653 RepID=UPI002629A070|nr:hypothetical protein [uncultured Dokdonia sp.]